MGRRRRVEQGAYTASLGQGVATVSGKCPLAGLFQLVVTRILYDGFKPRLHTDTQQRLAGQRPTNTQTQLRNTLSHPMNNLRAVLEWKMLNY